MARIYSRMATRRRMRPQTCAGQDAAGFDQ